MKVESKYPQNVSNATNLELEIFRNRYTNKISYKNENGVIKELENTDNSESVNTEQAIRDSIWANGFRIIGCIGEDITLPDNSNIEFTGPLAMCVGSTLTIPAGTTLTIV
jgi:hypothetical protein